MTDFELVNENVVSVKEEANALLPQEYIDMLYEYEEMKAKMEVLEREKNKALLKIMKKYKITEIDNDKWNVKLVCSHPRKSLDFKKLKDEGIYDLYLKEVMTNPYVKVKLKYEE